MLHLFLPGARLGESLLTYVTKLPLGQPLQRPSQNLASTHFALTCPEK